MAEQPSQPERGSLPHSQPRNIFVGRQREMAELRGALDDALSGQGRLVMLAGEPGVGKTRTTQELASYAEGQGAKVLWGWCYEEEGAPPYWPWVQSIRSYVQQASAEQLTAEMGHGAADIAEIVPNIRSKLPDLETPPALEPEQARFRLFDSITTFLNNASRSQPMMLVLDDLHWADRSSLLLLEFLAREIEKSPLLLVGCYRDAGLSRQHPLSETLAHLSREPVFRRQVLRGLAPDELGQFIEATTGVQLSQVLADKFYAHTEGNPFFMTEVIRLLSESGESIAEGLGAPDALGIPEGVREVIGQRLNRLSEQCNQALSIASLIGREFDFRLLSSLIGEGTEDRVLESIEEALAARVVEEPPGTMERYQFTHALIRETLVQELSTTRRARLHARIGQALEELYGASAETHAAELAHHFAEAQGSAGPEKLVRYSLLAGEQALASFANEDALDHFQSALGAMQGRTVDAAMADALFGLGKSQLATSQPGSLQVAVGNLILAFDYYANNGDVGRAVAIAEYPLPTGAYLLEEARLLVANALTLVEDASGQAGRLAARAGLYLGRTRDDYEGAQASFDRALSIARQKGDADLELLTLADRAEVDLFHLQLEQCQVNVQRAIQSARRVNNLQAEVQARQRATLASIITGDTESSRLHALEGLKLAEQLRHRWWLTTTIWGNQTVSQLAGDWQAAREFCDRGLAAAPNDLRIVANRVLLEYEAGSEEMRDLFLHTLLQVRADDPTVLSTQFFMCSFVVPLVFRATGTTDGLEVARAIATKALSFSSSPPLLTMIARSGLALIAVIERDATAAREQYHFLQPYRGKLVPNCAGCTTDRLLGLLAQTKGDLGQATSHFEDSLTFCRKANYRPELAWSCCDYADALLAAVQIPSTHSARMDGEARAKAISLLDESLTISTELGMHLLIERVNERLDQANATSEPPPAYPDGLSHREVEVLGLITLGKSNPEIAEQLFISPNTVAHHVTNILNKINAANRAEATAYAVRNGLA